MNDDLLLRLPRRFGRPSIGRVLLLCEIGRGAMGAVYAGWHQDTRSPCAVKVLLDPQTANAEQLGRFQREARICAELDDPTLVRVSEFGRESGWPYLVMEYVAGRGLDWVIKTMGPLTEVETFTVLRDVGQALLVLHRRGVIHRDIKPSNLLLRAEDGRIKITDLGIAKEVGASDGLLTQTVLGTPAYMSPEQVRDPSSIGPASDFFSLGSTMFTLLTGGLPFPGETAWDMMQNIRHRPLTDPRTLGVAISDAAWTLMERLTQKNAHERISTAEQLLEALPSISVPFRAEVLAVAQPSFQVRPPTEDDLQPLDLEVRDTSLAWPPVGSAATVNFEPLTENPQRPPLSMLFCQCLQNDFLAPPPPDSGLDWKEPNKLHVGRAEANRLVGRDPQSGPLVRAVSACAQADHVRMVHIRDWHDATDPRQRPELDFFGDHCLMGTWGARFIDAIEAYSRDRKRAAVVDAGGLNDLHDTPIMPMLEALVPSSAQSGNWRATMPIGVIGVWTNVKIHYLLYDLKTRLGLHNLATCSALVASPDRDAHETTLRHLRTVLNVKVFDDIEEFLKFLGVRSMAETSPATVSE
jgi:serine/threonine protein kinase